MSMGEGPAKGGGRPLTPPYRPTPIVEMQPVLLKGGAKEGDEGHIQGFY